MYGGLIMAWGLIGLPGSMYIGLPRLVANGTVTVGSWVGGLSSTDTCTPLVGVGTL